MINDSRAHTDDRVVAFGEVRRIVAEHRGGKLFDDEAEVLLDAASDMMLAASGEQVEEAREMFESQMHRLEASRWAEMVGTDAQPGTATRLRRAFAGCVPQAFPIAA